MLRRKLGVTRGQPASAGLRAVGLTEAQAFADLVAEPVGDGQKPVMRDAAKMRRVDRLLIVKAGKQELEQVFADRREGAFRRQV